MLAVFLFIVMMVTLLTAVPVLADDTLVAGVTTRTMAELQGTLEQGRNITWSSTEDITTNGSGSNALSYGAAGCGSATVEENQLKLVSTTSWMKYALKPLDMSIGNVVRLKVKMDTIPETGEFLNFNIYNGSYRLYLRFHTGGVTAGSVNIAAKPVSGSAYDLVFRSVADGYECWIKGSGETYTYMGTHSQSHTNSAGTDFMVFTNSSVSVESLTLYQPNPPKTLAELKGDLKKGRDITFSTDADITANGTTPTINGTGSATVVSNKLKLDSTGTSGYVQYKLNPALDMSIGDMVRLKLTIDKVRTDGVDTFNFNIHSGGKRAYVRFLSTCIQVAGDSSAQTVTINETVTDGATYDMVFRRVANGYDIWLKGNGETYTYMGTADRATTNTATEFMVFAGGTVSIEAVELYQPESSIEPPSDTTKTEAELTDKLRLIREILFPNEYAAKKNGTFNTETWSVIDEKLNLICDTGESHYSIQPYVNYKVGNAIRFKIKFTALGEFNHNIHVSGGKRLRLVIKKDVTSIGNTNLANSETALNETYDYIIFYLENGFELWRKGDSEENYRCLGIGPELSPGQSATYLQALSGCTTYISYYKVYDTIELLTNVKQIAGNKGNITLEKEQTGSVLKAIGSVLIGEKTDKYDRRATVIGVAHNKEHGYTSWVDENEIQFVPGYTKDLTTPFDISGVDLSKNDTTVMLWDSYDTGVALYDPQGNAGRNNAVGKPTQEQKDNPGLSISASYNKIRVSGYAGSVCNVTVLVKNSSGQVKAIGQVKTNQFGMVDTTVGVDPVACNSGSYTVQAQYGSMDPISETVHLYCYDEIQHSEINNQSDFAAFVNQFGTTEEKDAISDDECLTAIYLRFVDMRDEAQGDFDFFKIVSMVSGSINDEITERKILIDINAASAAEKWNDIQKILTDTYCQYLCIDTKAIEKINSPKNLFYRMTKIKYNDINQVKSVYYSAYEAQMKAEEESGSSASGGSTGGYSSGSNKSSGGLIVSGGSGSSGEQSVNIPYVGNVNDEKTNEFTDLSSVPWAEESILALKRMDVIRGYDPEHFNPNQFITREEFLKMVMNVMNIDTSDEELSQFSDVHPDDWYYSYIAGAYHANIVQGISDTQLGIGEGIIRADMAVMLVRAMESCEISPEQINPSIVFDDFGLMPLYAEKSVAKLYEAGLMQGVGNNCFAPNNKTTRAEAAVAIYRIYKYIKEDRLV